MQDPGPATLRLAGWPLDSAGPGGRLAELVAHLTDCAPTAAVEAVTGAIGADLDAELDVDRRLDVVAKALVAVRRGQPFDLRERHSA